MSCGVFSYIFLFRMWVLASLLSSSLVYSQTEEEEEEKGAWMK